MSVTTTAITLTHTTFGVSLLPPPLLPKYEKMSFADGNITRLVPTLTPTKALVLPGDGRDLGTMNCSTMLMDDPYESEEDEVGRATATKEAREIMEFERRLVKKAERAESGSAERA